MVRDGWALLFAATLTIAVELGCFFLGRIYHAEFRQSLLATLGIMSVWVVLAPAPLAAWGQGNFSALLRGGIVADATGVSLLVLWIISPAEGALTFSGVVKLYCIFASVVLVGISAVCLVKSQAGRLAAGLIAVGLLGLAIASPAWASANIGGPGQVASTQQMIVDWAIRVNPFYAACDAIVYQTNFVWHDWGLMYDFSRIGEYIPSGGVRWYQTCLLYLAASILLGSLAVVSGKLRKGCNCQKV